jgi:hypothetical protein
MEIELAKLLRDSMEQYIQFFMAELDAAAPDDKGDFVLLLDYLLDVEHILAKKSGHRRRVDYWTATEQCVKLRYDLLKNPPTGYKPEPTDKYFLTDEEIAALRLQDWFMRSPRGLMARALNRIDRERGMLEIAYKTLQSMSGGKQVDILETPLIPDQFHVPNHRPVGQMGIDMLTKQRTEWNGQYWVPVIDCRNPPMLGQRWINDSGQKFVFDGEKWAFNGEWGGVKRG